MNRRPRLRSRLLGVAAALILAGTVLEPAEGYRFLGFGPRTSVITSSSWPPFKSWRTDVWPPGEAVRIGIIEDPGRSRGVYERVQRLVENSLRYWSDIETADLKFDVQIVDPEEEEPGGHGLFVYVTDEDPPARARGGVRFRWRRGDEIGFAGCGVWIPNFYLNRFGTAYTVFVLVHEFGHCLGLHHPPAYPDANFRDQLADTLPGQDPVMSYGWNPTREFETTFGAGRLSLITTDDAIGISLLRPAPGWLETTGGVWGRAIRDDGTPLRYAPVLASRLENGEPAKFGVNGFTDAFGSFSIDGLEPGRYLVKVYPILFPGAHPALLGEATLEFPETTLLGPVEVRAGSRNGPLALYVQRE